MISPSRAGRKPKRVSGTPLGCKRGESPSKIVKWPNNHVACWQPLPYGHLPLTMKPSLVFTAFPGGANIIAVTESMSEYISRATLWLVSMRRSLVELTLNSAKSSPAPEAGAEVPQHLWR
jgi:hypothetical protein